MGLNFEVRLSNPPAPVLQATDCDASRVWETGGTLLIAIPHLERRGAKTTTQKVFSNHPISMAMLRVAT